jgi:hypothetical protein
MENNTVTFQKKWLYRAIHYRFNINNWFLQRFGLNGFALFAFAWGVGVTMIVCELLLKNK